MIREQTAISESCQEYAHECTRIITAALICVFDTLSSSVSNPCYVRAVSLWSRVPGSGWFHLRLASWVPQCLLLAVWRTGSVSGSMSPGAVTVTHLSLGGRVAGRQCLRIHDPWSCDTDPPVSCWPCGGPAVSQDPPTPGAVTLTHLSLVGRVAGRQCLRIREPWSCDTDPPVSCWPGGGPAGGRRFCSRTRHGRPAPRPAGLSEPPSPRTALDAFLAAHTTAAVTAWRRNIPLVMTE